eukprot:scaffold279579_cov22-Tisochrysis_lutea.AAC.1
MHGRDRACASSFFTACTSADMPLWPTPESSISLFGLLNSLHALQPPCCIDPLLKLSAWQGQGMRVLREHEGAHVGTCGLQG